MLNPIIVCHGSGKSVLPPLWLFVWCLGLLWRSYALQGNSATINEGMPGLAVFSLIHHSKLLPTFFGIIPTLSINVLCLEEVKCSNMEGLKCSGLVGR